MADSPHPNQPNQPPEGASRPESNPRWTRWMVWAALLAIFAVLILPNLISRDNSEETPYRQLIADLEKLKSRKGEQGESYAALSDDVTRLQINNTTGDILGWRNDGSTFRSIGPTELPAEDYTLISEAVGDEVEFTRPTSSIWSTLIPLLLPVGLLILFFWWMQRRAQGQMSGIMSIGRSRAKTYSTERPATTFDDVAGYENTKQEITEVVNFLKEPEKFARIGARIPKGILLVGPPGTGKTLIARAVAGEAGVPFLSVTGSDFMEMFVGVGASRVRDLFQSARKMGKAIIFIDEIDSIGRKRGAGLGGGHDEREQTLNQMLSEMDGFEATEGIVMIAATNRPDILDPALLRPGRFDRQVVVPLPELEDRLEILKVHVKGKSVDEDVDLSLLARGTPGMSGADLSNLINEAALTAVRAGRDSIFAAHLEEARDRVLLGQQRDSMALSEEEKKAVAYHEAGHAVCAASLPHADPLHKVSVIPSGMALGVTMQLPEQERHIYRQNYIEDTLVVRMGGRVAEELVFGVVSTGANDDLVGATQMAKKMVREWGMSERLGPMAWGAHEEVFLGEEIVSTRDYSDETARLIDEEVERILREQEGRCRKLLTKRRLALDLVANALLEKESIPGSEVLRLLNLAEGNGTDASTADSERIEIAAASALASSVRPA